MVASITLMVAPGPKAPHLSLPEYLEVSDRFVGCSRIMFRVGARPARADLVAWDSLACWRLGRILDHRKGGGGGGDG